ncbi:MAG: TylF/MycF/NovP-related O-methyltransferase [Promethearchaeota archaeon]
MVKKEEIVGGRNPFDMKIWDRIEKVVEEKGHSLRQVLESFPIYVRRVNLSRFIMLYELFKKIVEIPGSIVECGVFRGSSLLTWAKLLEIFCPGDRERRVIGFDNFAGFTEFVQQDGPSLPIRSKVVGGWSAEDYYDELLKHLQIFKDDSFLSRAPNRIELVVGNIEKTAHEYLKNNSGLRICLLNIDCDMYKPTKAALDAFYPLVITGGIIILDDYGVPEWAGESAAFDEYFAEKGEKAPKLKTLPYFSAPTSYFIKGE